MHQRDTPLKISEALPCRLPKSSGGLTRKGRVTRSENTEPARTMAAWREWTVRPSRTSSDTDGERGLGSLPHGSAEQNRYASLKQRRLEQKRDREALERQENQRLLGAASAMIQGLLR
jgi:hypothetical protein